jgi:hypothetical protein
MPKDLYELVADGWLHRAELICPAHDDAVLKAGFLADNSPVFVSSFRLLVPGSKLAQIPDGTVVVQEFEGNHPGSTSSGYSYAAGYHVIIKDHNDFRYDFISSSAQPATPATE